MTKSAPLLALVLLLGYSAQGATTISSITSSGGFSNGGTLQSITVNSVIYSSLTAPSTLSSADTVDYLSIAPTVPTNIVGALGGLNLDTGTLNYDFTVQFGQVAAATDLFFLINNTSPSLTFGDAKSPKNQFFCHSDIRKSLCNIGWVFQKRKCSAIILI
jgi:hypothetical protein